MAQAKAVGKKFGKLTVLSVDYKKHGKGGTNVYYRVRCECGRETSVASGNLYQGRTKSCGKKGCQNRFGTPHPKIQLNYHNRIVGVREIGEMSGYCKPYIYTLLKNGLTPEQIIQKKKKSLRTRVAEKYGRTREWVRQKLLKGYIIEEEDNQVYLVKK